MITTIMPTTAGRKYVSTTVTGMGIEDAYQPRIVIISNSRFESVGKRVSLKQLFHMRKGCFEYLLFVEQFCILNVRLLGVKQTKR